MYVDVLNHIGDMLHSSLLLAVDQCPIFHVLQSVSVQCVACPMLSHSLCNFRHLAYNLDFAPRRDVVVLVAPHALDMLCGSLLRVVDHASCVLGL